ncbi:MAG: metallophosphoesterase, partial [Clostridia bacterium]|nr:metallophosphoesterase [Clostridia bacterium]
MKKIIALILSVILVIGCAPLTFASGNDLSMIFVTDTHFSKVDSSNPVTKSTDENPFGHVVSNGKLVHESAAIYDEFFKQAAESDADYIVVTGDISDNGIVENVEAVVAKWEEFEKTSGKTVIACMGNHETYHLSATNTYISGGLTGPEFRELYKNLGYDKALAIDEASASYTVDLNSKYRLIVVDTNALNERLSDWIGEQAEAAKADGKYLISASHFPLFSHNKIFDLVKSGCMEPSLGMPDKYIDWGIKYNFSGHTHEMDTAQYTNKKGVVYDITNGALTTYPANYKTAKFTDKKITIGTKYIEKIDMSLVPDGLAKEAYDLCKDDFREYARKMFVEGAQKEIGYYINTNYLVNFAKLDRTRDAEIINLIDTVITRFNEAIRLPLYGENSLSSIAKQYGHRLAKSDYNTIFEV